LLFGVSPKSALVTTKWVEKGMKDISKKYQYVDTGLVYFTALLTLIMMVLSSTDIILRWLFNSPITGTYEAMQFMMGGVAFLAFAFVQLKRSHISVTVISEKYTGKTAIVVDILSLLLMLLISAVWAWAGARNALEAWKYGDVTVGLVELPLGPAKMVVPLGCGVLCLRFILQIIEQVALLIKESKK
jgi:TRAP-type C4-dicarboxylate transport system permease small subunit